MADDLSTARVVARDLMRAASRNADRLRGTSQWLDAYAAYQSAEAAWLEACAAENEAREEERRAYAASLAATLPDAASPAVPVSFATDADDNRMCSGCRADVLGNDPHAPGCEQEPCPHDDGINIVNVGKWMYDEEYVAECKQCGENLRPATKEEIADEGERQHDRRNSGEPSEPYFSWAARMGAVQ